MTSADPLSDFKTELVTYYKDKGSAWSGSMWASKFYSESMADKDNVMQKATKLVQDAGSKTGGTTMELRVPCSMAQVLLCSCRSERLANMTRVQCLASVLNEAMLMQKMVTSKMDGIKK
jgi:hypothetical protein